MTSIGFQSLNLSRYELKTKRMPSYSYNQRYIYPDQIGQDKQDKPKDFWTAITPIITTATETAKQAYLQRLQERQARIQRKIMEAQARAEEARLRQIEEARRRAQEEEERRRREEEARKPIEKKIIDIKTIALIAGLGLGGLLGVLLLTKRR